MKTLLIVAGIAGLVLGLAGSSGAQQSERVYRIVELTDEDLTQIDIHDGSIDDWLEVVGEPTLTVLEFSTYPQEGLLDLADMDFRIWLGWHDATNRIYGAMERADDVVINEFDRASENVIVSLMNYHDTSMELVVDADHSGGQYIGFGGMQRGDNRQAQMYKAIAEVYDRGPQVDMLNSHIVRQDWFRLPPNAEGGGAVFSENPTISVTEFYVTPFDLFVWDSAEESVVSDLVRGRVIGLAISVPDRDEDEAKPSVYYHLGDIASPLSDNFADFLLLGPSGEIPDDSAVESITWGRIKAQFVE